MLINCWQKPETGKVKEKEYLAVVQVTDHMANIDQELHAQGIDPAKVAQTDAMVITDTQKGKEIDDNVKNYRNYDGTTDKPSKLTEDVQSVFIKHLLAKIAIHFFMTRLLNSSKTTSIAAVCGAIIRILKA